MATHETTIHPFPAQGRTSLTITSEEISHYAELSALVTQLEAQQKALRAELLSLYEAGAEQEETSPYLLAFVEQERRTVDWRGQALALAAKVHGLDKVAAWQAEVEQSTPVTPVTSIRVKPNPSFAAGLSKPAVSVRIPAGWGCPLAIDEDVKIHICPDCKDELASGADPSGSPACCLTCEALRKLQRRHFPILPARQQPRLSGRRKKP